MPNLAINVPYLSLCCSAILLLLLLLLICHYIRIHGRIGSKPSISADKRVNIGITAPGAEDAPLPAEATFILGTPFYHVYGIVD